MLKEKVTINRDDAMSKNYYKERLDNISHWSWKNVKYGYKKLSIVREEDMNIM